MPRRRGVRRSIPARGRATALAVLFEMDGALLEVVVTHQGGELYGSGQVPIGGPRGWVALCTRMGMNSVMVQTLERPGRPTSFSAPIWEVWPADLPPERRARMAVVGAKPRWSQSPKRGGQDIMVRTTRPLARLRGRRRRPGNPQAGREMLIGMARSGRGSSAHQQAGALLDEHGDDALALATNPPARVAALLRAAGCLPLAEAVLKRLDCAGVRCGGVAHIAIDRRGRDLVVSSDAADSIDAQLAAARSAISPGVGPRFDAAVREALAIDGRRCTTSPGGWLQYGGVRVRASAGQLDIEVDRGPESVSLRVPMAVSPSRAVDLAVEAMLGRCSKCVGLEVAGLRAPCDGCGRPPKPRRPQPEPAAARPVGRVLRRRTGPRIVVPVSRRRRRAWWGWCRRLVSVSRSSARSGQDVATRTIKPFTRLALPAPLASHPAEPMRITFRFDRPEQAPDRVLVVDDALVAQRLLDRHRPGWRVGCVVRDRESIRSDGGEWHVYWYVQDEIGQTWSHGGFGAPRSPLAQVFRHLRQAQPGWGTRGRKNPSIPLGCSSRPLGLPAPGDETPRSDGDRARAARARRMLARRRPWLTLRRVVTPDWGPVRRVRWNVSQPAERGGQDVTVNTTSPLRAAWRAIWHTSSEPSGPPIPLHADWTATLWGSATFDEMPSSAPRSPSALGSQWMHLRVNAYIAQAQRAVPALQAIGVTGCSNGWATWGRWSGEFVEASGGWLKMVYDPERAARCLDPRRPVAPEGLGGAFVQHGDWFEAVDEPCPYLLAQVAIRRALDVLGEAPLLASVAAVDAAELIQIEEPEPRALRAPPAESGTWRALVRRDGGISRWSPVDPAGADALAARTPGLVRVDVLAGADVDGLAALADGPAGAEQDAPAVLWISDSVAILDHCPTPLRRAVRWAIVARAQDAGVQLLDADVEIDWASLDEVALFEQARRDPELAAELLAAVDETRRRIDRLPARGPDESPAIMGPCPSPGSMDIETIRRAMPGAYAVVRRAVEKKGLTVVSTSGRQVRRRKTPQGRKRRVSVGDYLDARARQADAGLDVTDMAIYRALNAQGVKIGISAVRQRRIEAEAAVRMYAPGATVDDPQAEWRARSTPFMIYTGGKGRLLPHLLGTLPDGVFDLYVEPCLGAGALLLELAARGRFERAIAADIDADVINLWQWVQRDPVGVFEKASAWPWTREGYFEAREAISNSTGIERAGATLRVNRNAWNAVWRRTKGTGLLSMGPGDQAGLGVTAADLQRVAELVADVEFICIDAERLIRSIPVGEGELVVVYVDVPYWPVSSTANHCVYAGRGFQAGDHVRIVGAMHDLAERGALGVFSNSSNAPVQRLVAAAGGETRLVAARRSVSVKGSTRGGAPEVIGVFRPAEAGRIEQVAS